MTKPSGPKSALSTIKLLSENLEAFYPDLKNHFMCPTCLRKISLEEKRQISDAHIIPQSAGGTLKTYLCKKCNNDFGSKQDKWFGELIRISKTENSSIFSTIIKDKYFKIDGMRVNGSWKKNNEGNFEFFIYANRNSPEAIKVFRNHFKTHKSKLNLSFPLPILKNEKLIDIGFLTAGYLMWFHYFGYSWVLQNHLQQIREQILHPHKEIITARYVFTANSIDWKPFIGIILLDGIYVPVFGIGKHLVVFPPRSHPRYYKDLKRASRDINMNDIRSLSVPERPKYGPPLFILYENDMIIAPDLTPGLMNSVIPVRYSKESTEGTILRPINKEESDILKQDSRAELISINLE